MERSADPAAPETGVAADPEALKGLKFYAENYEQITLPDLGLPNKQIILGTYPSKCRFCAGESPVRTFKKRAHAISELLGNKVIKSLYECDQCNERFSAFEDDLAKMTLPFRSLGGVVGKNGVPTLLSASGEASLNDELRDIDGANKIVGLMNEIANALDAIGPGRVALARLLDHPDDRVRASAGAYLLIVGLMPERVLPVLHEIEDKGLGDSADFTAHWAIVGWEREGKFGVRPK